MVRGQLKIASISVLLFFTHPVFAKPNIGGKKRKKAKTEEKTGADEESSGGTSTGRKLGFGLNISPYGLGLAKPVLGGEGFIYTGKNIEFFSNFLFGTTDLSKDLQKTAAESAQVDAAKFNGMQFLMGAHYFFGSSFYVSGSLGLRRFLGVIQLSSGTRYFDVEISSDSLAIGGGVGNKWYISERFYVGAEWIALHIPFALRYNQKPETVGYDSVNEDNLKKISEELARKLAQASSGTLLNVMVGLAF